METKEGVLFSIIGLKTKYGFTLQRISSDSFIDHNFTLKTSKQDHLLIDSNLPGHSNSGEDFLIILT